MKTGRKRRQSFARRQAMRLPAVSGVYLMRNSLTGEKYIGAATNIQRRALEHIFNIRSGKTSYEIRKSFDELIVPISFRLVEECDEIDLPGREAYWIKQFNATLNTRKPSQNHTTEHLWRLACRRAKRRLKKLEKSAAP